MSTKGSINKALDILEDLSAHGPSSLAEMHTRLEQDKGTLHRNLKVLKERGYVFQGDSDRRYSNTVKMFQLGSAELERGGLRMQLRPYLEKLAETFKEVIHVSLFVEQSKVICIDKIEAVPGSQARLNLSLGSEVSLFASSMGKSLLAFAPEEVRAGILAALKFEKFSPTTITSVEDLEKDLRSIRRRGYALDDGETMESIFCVGVPIFNRQCLPYTAISVTGPKTRMLDKKEDIISMLLAISRDASLLNGCPAQHWPVIGE